MTDSESTASDSQNNIAIIGMDCRFPDAPNLDQFWHNLRNGVESIRFFSEEDLREAGQDPAALRVPGYVNAGAVVEDPEWFDADFFGFSPRDAEILDPQQRLFLECAWNALEHAGYVPDSCPDIVGVFGGVDFSKYSLQLYSNQHILESMGGFQIALANDKDHLTTRTAYKLNLKGPAVTVQTTCSTSLVAVCLACENLLQYQCDIALAGGSALNLPQHSGYLYQEGGITSPDGHCRPFDALAQGTLASSGAGMVALKRLEDALEDGDFIHAVIGGFGLNNDGAQKVGYTAPSIEGQMDAIAAAQAMAGYDPETLTYIEAHGTATPLGDPIEVTALTNVFRASTDRCQYCALGSVKSNIGHLNSAAGVAGLIKTVLALRHGQIPPSLHFEQPNPNIDFTSSPFFVADRLIDWQRNGAPRRAGVSAFGIGGTNAHILLEEAPAQAPASPGHDCELYVVSARNPKALEEATRALSSLIEEESALALPDIAHSLQVGRKPFQYRFATVCPSSDRAMVVDALQKAETASVAPIDDSRSVVFLFSGQGSQYPGMGRELYDEELVFRQHVDQCSELLKDPLDCDLREVLYPSDSSTEKLAEMLSHTAMAQPALFVTEYALARLWMSWGVTPSAMVGHSIGEYVAACIAGVWELPDALALVSERGRLMERTDPGAMVAVLLPAEEVLPLLFGQLALAAINSPSACVVAGPKEEIDQFEEEGLAKGRTIRRLHTSHAFHSPLMEPAANSFVEYLQRFQAKAPDIPLLSNLTGTWTSPEQLVEPEYWARHLRETVQFDTILRELYLEPNRVLLEVGPGNTLASLASQHPNRTSAIPISHSLPHAKDPKSARQALLEAAGTLWTSGVDLDWLAIRGNERRNRVPLPTYPFQRQRYWVDPPTPVPTGGVAPAQGGIIPTLEASPPSRKDPNLAQWFYREAWKPHSPTQLSGDDLESKTPWLLFMTGSDFDRQLARRLQELGQSVITVEPSDFFAVLGSENYRVDPLDRTHFDQLVKELAATDSWPSRILHLWGMNLEAVPAEQDEMAQEPPFQSLLNLIRSFGGQLSSGEIEIGVVGQRMCHVHSTDAIDPMQASGLGVCRVAPQEYPGLRCRMVDLRPEGLGSATVVIDQLIAEMALEPRAAVVAYRGRTRWVQSFEPYSKALEIGPNSVLRPQGVYLITGGMGQIGLLMARFLSFAIQAKVVLVNRSPMPPRDEWELILKERPYDPAAYRVAQLLEIEAMGGVVEPVSADIADEDQMREVIEDVIGKYGTIHGVIHGAAHTGEGALTHILESGPELCSAHFRPKAQGLAVLEKLLGDESLDFWMLHSSLSALLGGLGFAAYAASNCYLDAYATKRNREKRTRWICVNWDAWYFPTGAESPQHLPPTVLNAIHPADGLDLFQRLFSNAPEHVIVSTYDLKERFEQWIEMSDGISPEEQAPIAPEAAPSPQVVGSTHPRPALSTALVGPSNAVEQNLVELWQELLGVAPIGIEDNFFELGGHSLLAIQLVSRIRDRLGFELPVGKVFEAPTVSGVSAAIEEAEAAPTEEKTKQPPLVRVSREAYQSQISESGELELPDKLRTPPAP